MDSLLFNKKTENLIELSWRFCELRKDHEELMEIDSATWKELLCSWSNEFEETYAGADWSSGDYGDYLDVIEKFADEKIFEFSRKGGVDVITKGEMIKELFQLAMTAIEETDDYVNFEISNYSYACTVLIKEGGFGKREGYDGAYDLVDGNNDWEKEMQQKEFRKAKKHLEKLIEKARRNKLEVAV